MHMRKFLCLIAFAWLAMTGASGADEPRPNVDLYGDPLPPGAVSRLGTVRFRHHGELKGVTYSADGQTLFGFTEEAFISWESESGKLTGALPIETHNVLHAAFSADRRRAVTAGAILLPTETMYSIQVWDLTTQRPLNSVYLEQGSPPACVALNAAGTRFAVGDHHGTARIYESESKEELLDLELGDLKLGELRIRTLAFSPTDERLVVGLGESDRAFLWNWREAEAPQLLDGAAWPEFVAWSPDGTRFAIARNSAQAQGIDLYDAESGENIRKLADGPGYRSFQGIAFSPDGRVLASSDHGTKGITVWNTTTGDKLFFRRAIAAGKWLVIFSPDGTWLTSWGASLNHARVHSWDVRTGEPLRFTAVGHEQIPSAIEFLPGDEIVATAGDDGTLRFWEVTTGRQIRLAAHRPGDTDGEDTPLWIRGIAISPDGKFAATSSQDDTVRVWNVDTSDEIRRLPGHGRLGGWRAVRFTAGGSRLLSCGGDLVLRTFDLRTEAMAERALRPSGINIQVTEKGGRTTVHAPGVTLGAVAFSSDARRLVLGLRPGSYHVIDASNGQELNRITVGGRRPHKMAVAADGRYMLTADHGRRVRRQLPGGRERVELTGEFEVQLLALPSGEKIREWTLDGRTGGPVAFGPDGEIFAVAAWEVGKPLRVFETASGRLLAEIEGFDGYHWAIAFSNDGQLLASSLTSGSVLIWDWRQFEN